MIDHAIYSDRVELYSRYRPSYPHGVLDALRDAGSLRPSWVVADVGSGTGIFTRLLLDNGNTVLAVEPDPAMRTRAEDDLRHYSGFASVAGSAEHTTLAPGSVDLITVAQAFHWFDPVRCSLEFRRIVRPGATAALLWNERRRTGTRFLTALESLLTGLLPEYAAVAAHDARLADTLTILFAGGEFVHTTIPHQQVLDEDGLVGRVLSGSYAPGPGQPLRPALDWRLRALHRSHARNGGVHVDYDTLVVQGALR